MARSRSFVFTINNYTDDDIAEIMAEAENAKYLIAGFEEGEQGTPHIQGYVYYDNAKQLKTFANIFSRAYTSIAKGSPKQNQDYCSKDGDFWEKGSLPESGKITWERMLEVYKNPQEAPHLYNIYRKTVEEVLNREAKDSKKETKFYVHETVHDAITEIYEYFGWQDQESTPKVAVVNDLSKLENYSDYDNVIFFSDFFNVEYYLWTRGAPISYKVGYIHKVINPEKMIIVTNTPSQYKLYKLI